MNTELDKVFTQYLVATGELASKTLGAPSSRRESGEDDAQEFKTALEACKASMQRRGNWVMLAYFALLTGLVAVILHAMVSSSATVLAAALGGSGVAGLVIIPRQMSAMNRDLMTAEATLSLLPMLPLADRAKMVRQLYQVGKEPTRAKAPIKAA